MKTQSQTGLAAQDRAASPDLGQAVLDALDAAGKDIHRLTLDDLAPLDELHSRGRWATVELAERLHLAGSEVILDAGCGLGGAARYLAAAYGCRVTGLDPNPAYIRAAEMLTARLELTSKVTFRQGSAARLPFEPESFDIVWTQHAAMNVADKPALYREFHRVLKPGGRLAFYDVLAGPGGPVIFPVPWAREASESSLIAPADLRALLVAAGFRPLFEQDDTQASLAFFKKQLVRLRDGLPPLGAHLLLGTDYPRMVENVARCLEEDRAAVVMAVWQKMD